MPNVNLTAPYSTQQAELDRRRKMAQALQQEAMTPLDMPQHPGVSISPYAGLAKILSGVIGNYKGRKLDKEQRELDTSKQQAVRDQMAQLLNSQGGSTMLQTPGLPQSIATQAEVTLPPDPWTNANALSSEFPQVQEMAQTLAVDRIGQGKEQRQQAFQREQTAGAQQFASSQTQAQMAQALALANRPKAAGSYAPGGVFGTEDPATGTFTPQGSVPNRPLATPAPRTVTTEQGVFKLNQDGSLGDRLGDRPKNSQQTQPNTPFELWRAQHPNAPIADWFNLSNPKSGRATVAETKAMGFFDRIYNAKTAIDSMEADINKLDMGGQARLTNAPNWLQSPLGKRFNQASGEFINAALRRESGAAISASEYERFGKIYFPQTGDDEPTLQQKAQSRQAVMDSLKREAGNAYSNAYEDGETIELIRGPDGKLRPR